MKARISIFFVQILDGHIQEEQYTASAVCTKFRQVTAEKNQSE